MNNNLQQDTRTHPRFGIYSPYVLVICEVRVRIRKKSRRLPDKSLRAEVMTSHFLDEMLTRPSKSLEPRVEPAQYRFSPWLYYVVRREFRLIEIKADMGTINIVAVIGPKISSQQLHYAYKDCMIVYPDLSDHDI